MYRVFCKLDMYRVFCKLDMYRVFCKLLFNLNTKANISALQLLNVHVYMLQKIIFELCKEKSKANVLQHFIVGPVLKTNAFFNMYIYMLTIY